MNVIVRQGISLDDFLAWEQQQDSRYEFDGVQPIPMTGGTLGHALLISHLVFAIRTRLGSSYSVLGGDLKVKVAEDRIRYPDVLVLPAGGDRHSRIVEPVVVAEVLSPSTALTDLSVKPEEYASVRSLMAYVILSQEPAGDVLVLRRSTRWRSEPVTSLLELPEIGVSIPLSEIYRD